MYLVHLPLVQPSPLSSPGGFSSCQKEIIPIRQLVPISPCPRPSPWQPLTCFLSLWLRLFWTSPIHGIVHLWAFVSGEVFSSFIHVVAWISTSFLFMSGQYCIVWIDCICLSVAHWWTLGLLPFFGCCVNRTFVCKYLPRTTVSVLLVYT